MYAACLGHTTYSQALIPRSGTPYWPCLQVVDIYAAACLGNSAVTEGWRDRLLKKGAVDGLVKMLAMHDDADRQRVAVLALVNFAFSGGCQERMADLGSVEHLVEILKRHRGKGEVSCPPRPRTIQL